MKKLFILLLIITTLLPSALGATSDDVRNMFNSGDYATAMQTAETLLKKTPKDANLHYWLGRSALEVGNLSKAKASLQNAAERGLTDAYPFLVDISIDNYDISGAESYIDSWKAALKKAKKTVPPVLDELESRLVLITNQLDRVEDIPVIARYDVSRSEFDSAIEKHNSPSAEKGRTFIEGNIPFFINNTNREVFWTRKDEDGVSRLFTAGILDDGTLEDAVELTEYIGDGDIMSPFMLEDGETLYFAASRGNDGLGGYDIFMTRRDGEGGFYEPSNVGMPYNSTGNDLLFVIDEENNLGWWATDRFAAPDSVSIFVFVPNSVRVNIAGDDENLSSRAKISDIKLTQSKDFDVKGALKRIPVPDKEDKNSGSSSSFALSLGDGRVITSASQLRNREAASLMSDVLRAKRVLSDNIERLESMRRSFAEGDTSLREDIRTLETEVERQQNDLKNLTNRVIRFETMR